MAAKIGSDVMGDAGFDEVRSAREEVRSILAAAGGLEETERKAVEAALDPVFSRLEARIHLRTAELEAANEEMESFAYSIAHDLRGPLRGINGLSRTLLEDCADLLDGESRESLERICQISILMGELIDDLLSLSRVSRQPLHRETLDLGKLARDIADGLQMRDPARSGEFLIQEGLIASGDRHLVMAALENLLSNAWKFTRGRNPARIEVGKVDSSSGGGSTDGPGPAVYFVRDNGAGFDMEFAGKLFNPFQRLHTQDEFEGTGIGLATVHRVVQRHGGAVRAEAAVGQGAAFYFTLPDAPGN